MSPENARERARKRLKAWWDAVSADTPRVTQRDLALRMPGWQQQDIGRVIANGPRLEDLDDVARMTRLPVEYFVVSSEPPQEAARDARTSAMEQALLEWFRSLDGDGRAAVSGVARALADRSRMSDAQIAGPRLPETPVRVLRHAAGRGRTRK